METGSSSPKRMWRAINTVLDRTELYTAVDFAKFFKEKVESVRCDTANAAPPHFQETTGKWLNEFEHVTEEEVVQLIASATNKQSSLDPLPAKYLKKVNGDVACILDHIFNRSFENGYVPRKFKNATSLHYWRRLDSTLTIQVTSDPYRTSRWHPRFSSVSSGHVHLNRIGTIPSVQSAYRRNHSPETALAKLSSDIIMAADRGDVSLLALLDLSAAFDTVDHCILLQRLHTSHHINGLVLDWFRSYLTGRRESVLYGGETTSAVLVEYRVPQGSVLGPLLFVLYTSDVPYVINEWGLLSVVYADDTQNYIQVKQSLINMAARGVSGRSRFDHITDFTRDYLH